MPSSWHQRREVSRERNTLTARQSESAVLRLASGQLTLHPPDRHRGLMRVEGRKQDGGFRLMTISNGFALGWASRTKANGPG